jgi:hypothetical protein
MMRTLTLATALAAVLALPAMAEEKTKIEPGTGPTGTMTQQVPQMKSDAEVKTGAPDAKGASMTLTSQEAQAWVGKPVYSSDGKKLGEVAAISTADNKVTEMDASIGGFLGLGEHRIRLMPAQFKLQSDRVVLDLTAEQAKKLPKIPKA